MPAGMEEVVAGVVLDAEAEAEVEAEVVGGSVGVRGVANWGVDVKVLGLDRVVCWVKVRVRARLVRGWSWEADCELVGRRARVRAAAR